MKVDWVGKVELEVIDSGADSGFDGGGHSRILEELGQFEGMRIIS